MRPEPEDNTINIPITFDYNGGRADNRKSNVITTLVLFAIAIVLTILFLRNANSGIFLKIVEVVATWLVVITFVRFRLLRESVYSDAYESLKEIDYEPGTDSFWNIYEIDDDYPYICHFKNGLAGIFVRLEKDVVVGKPSDVAFTHAEAISDAYNIAGSLDINMVHIDYMDNVGNDARLKGMYDSLEDCENPDMREAMMELLANLQDDMSQYYASYDVYLFTTRLKQDQLWYNVKLVIDRLLSGNYLSYSALNIDGVRNTCSALFNLTEFSAKEACDNIFKGTKSAGLVPIQIETLEGVKKLNKTQAEKRQEAAEAERAKEEKKSKRKLSKRLDAKLEEISSGGGDTTAKKADIKPAEVDNSANTSDSDDWDVFS